MFLWPSFTPGSVSTSMSRSAARWCSAKLRICAWANLMSAMVLGWTFARIFSMSDCESFFGTHLSNFSEYSRTAAPPRFLTSARMPSTVCRTFWSISSVTSRAMRRLRKVAMGPPGGCPDFIPGTTGPRCLRLLPPADGRLRRELDFDIEFRVHLGCHAEPHQHASRHAGERRFFLRDPNDPQPILTRIHGGRRSEPGLRYDHRDHRPGDPGLRVLRYGGRRLGGSLQFDAVILGIVRSTGALDGHQSAPLDSDVELDRHELDVAGLRAGVVLELDLRPLGNQALAHENAAGDGHHDEQAEER